MDVISCLPSHEGLKLHVNVRTAAASGLPGQALVTAVDFLAGALRSFHKSLFRICPSPCETGLIPFLRGWHEDLSLV